MKLTDLPQMVCLAGLIYTAAPAVAQYSVTFLPLPAGIPDDQNSYSRPVAPNNKGQVAGIVGRTTASVPVLWTKAANVVLSPSGFI